MGGVMKLGAAGAALVLTAGVLASCGSSGATESSSTVANPLAGYPKGPTREFIVPGEDNAVQQYGREGSPAERREASDVIHRWMKARVAGDWAGECRYFHRAMSEYMQRGVFHESGRRLSCPKALAFEIAHGIDRDRVNTLSGPIDSLRVGEGHGFAQYHGRDGLDWIVAVRKEDGKWKVDILKPVERFK